MITDAIARQLIAQAILLSGILLIIVLALALLVRSRLGITPVPSWTLPWSVIRLLSLMGVLAVGVFALGSFAAHELWPVLRGPQASDWPAVVVQHTPQAVERGRYLVQNVAHCTVCHSKRDETLYSSPVVQDSLGSGGYVPKEANYFPETMYPPNLTPTYLGEWSDNEILRAITQGISRDGRALHPLMPYSHFGQLQPSDAAAIVAYLRTLTPLPITQTNRPLSWAERKTAVSTARRLPMKINTAEPASRGRYLVTIGACALCHTPTSAQGVQDPTRPFAGGNELITANGTIVRSANLTPDRETGIGYWSEETFLNRFAGFRDRSSLTTPTRGAYNTVMPWHHFAQMTPSDLRDIYAYLRTQTPIRNEFERIVGVAAGH